jgi:hypothetical protein
VDGRVVQHDTTQHNPENLDVNIPFWWTGYLGLYSDMLRAGRYADRISGGRD